MAGSVNKVILVGNLGRDPEIRTTQNGSKVVSMTVATSESWTDKTSGERKKKTDWHRVTIWNERLADVAERFCRKGRKVYIEGALQTRKFTDQSGQEKDTTEIVLDRFRGELTLLDSDKSGNDQSADSGGWDAGSGRASAPRAGGRAKAASAPDWPPRGGRDADLDEPIPF